MAQAAYRCDDAVQEEGSWLSQLAVTVSLFGDNSETLAIMAEDAHSAGLVPNAGRALQTLVDADAGVLGDVVLVDCPSLDGSKCAALLRLDERARRSGAQLVVSTSREALDEVFACLEWSKPILLVRPSRAERLVALGEALTRMPGRRLRELDPQDRTTLLKLTQEVGRLAERLDNLSGGGDAEDDVMRVSSPSLVYDRGEGTIVPQQRHARAPLPDPRWVRQIIAQRRLRDEFLGAELFADPAWDMLLDLTAARAEHKRVSVTSLCIAAAVPATTALRWIAQMVENGLLVREEDGEDRRRVFIALSDRTAEAMARYFDRLGSGSASPV
ncbi:MAG: winged helix DNA-binding protein [Sphingomonadaceae bacterium]